MSPKLNNVSRVNAAERRVQRDLAFTERCKNTGLVYTYDFSKKTYAKSHRSITEIFVWAMYKCRHSQGHETRLSIITLANSFFQFLGDFNFFRPEELNRACLSRWVEWLKERSSLSYSTAASQHRGLCGIFQQMKRHKDVPDSFVPPKNPFPKSGQLTTANIGYGDTELKAILRAVVSDMKNIMRKIQPYEFKWKGKPPPIDDVAPSGSNGSRSIWESFEYKVWWWENGTNCQRLNFPQLMPIPGSQVFVASFQEPSCLRMKGVYKFYDDIGAGDTYIPRYLGKECPIKYSTPWKKHDFMVWYWENEVGEYVYGKEAKTRFPDFAYAISEYYPSYQSFYDGIGLYKWFSAVDLVPFYLMLLFRTFLNPSTTQRLPIDCLSDHPLDGTKVFLDYVKFRSGRIDKTIPSDRLHDGWPVSIVNKVIEITGKYREPGQKELWITNSNRYRKSLPLGKAGFKYAVREFALKHDLKDAEGRPLELKANLIRPSVAWQGYLKTDDLNFLQSLLGHTKITQTADYLRRVGDPVLRFRRAMHQNAMLLDLAGESYRDEILLDEEFPDMFLSHCRDPSNSPIKGQKVDQPCGARHEVCLGCENIVVTPSDIKRYFCFIDYYVEVFRMEAISEGEFNEATAEKRFMWETYILPRYSPELIEHLRAEAKSSPVSPWDPLSLKEV